MISRSDRYQSELKEAAASAAVSILDTVRSGATFPTIKTLQILQAAWLAGHQSGYQLGYRSKRRLRPEEER